MNRLKQYRLGISRTFPKTHSRAGEETRFELKLKMARDGVKMFPIDPEDGENIYAKLHTIRKNYPLWKHRVDEVNAGRAELVLYEWEGLPRKSKQRELFRFNKDSGIGTQMIMFTTYGPAHIPPVIVRDDDYDVAPSCHTAFPELDVLARNDGLSFDDFRDWLKHYDLSKPLAIIHFTPFRY